MQAKDAMPEPFTSISVIIPACNEEKYLPPGIAALQAEIARAQGQRPGLQVEVILVDNASTDRTADLARAAGFRVVPEAEHKIARVRNTGARAATGAVLITIDADSQIGSGALTEALAALEAGAVGGGCRILFDEPTRLNRSLAAIVTGLVRLSGLGAGMYYCRRADFEAIGGFNEGLYAAEDLEFARRLKVHGRRTGRRFVNLERVVMTTSARKMRLFGLWRIFRLLLSTVWRMPSATRRKDPWNRLFYDVDKLR